MIPQAVLVPPNSHSHLQTGSPKPYQSYAMAKRKQKYAVPSSKDHLGCMSGLIGIFNLLQGHPSQKLISDDWQVNCKQPTGPVNDIDGLNMLIGWDQGQKKFDTSIIVSGCGDRKLAGTEAGMTSISNPQYGGKAEIQKSKKNRKKANKKLQSNSANVYLFMDEVCSQSNKYQELHLEQKCLNAKLAQKHVILDQGLTDTTEDFLIQKFIKAKQINTGGAIHQSRVIKDVLEVLNLNKKLFIKMLEDPNSLLAKHIQDLRTAQMEKMHTTEAHKQLGKHVLSVEETYNSSNYVEPANHKTISQHNRYFRRKHTKKGMGSSKGGEIIDGSSNKIVFLKPNSSTSETRFSLAHFKMRLKVAIREWKRNWPDIAYNSHNLAKNGIASEVFKQLPIAYKEGSSEDCKPEQRDEFYPNNLSLLGQENENNKMTDPRKNETDFKIEGVTAGATPNVGNCILENIRGEVENKGTINTLCCVQEQGLPEVNMVFGTEGIFEISRENLRKEMPSLSSALASFSPECILHNKAEVTEGPIEKPECPSGDIIPGEYAISPPSVSSTQPPTIWPQKQETSVHSEIAFCQNPSENAIYKYITSVPTYTCSSCEELEERSHPPSFIVDSSLLLAQLKSTVSKLLLYTEEDLQDIHKQLLDCLSRFLCINPHRKANLVDQEILDIIDWYLHPPDPHTLEQIFCKDLAKNRSWMDLQYETEEITWKLGDAILEELVKEIMFSL